MTDLNYQKLNEDELPIGPAGPNAFGPNDPPGATDPNVQSTDENMTITEMFLQTHLPSLPREIGAYVDVSGSTAGIFALRNKKDTAGKDISELELVRQNVAVYPSKPIKTNITQEVIQDLYSMYGMDAYTQICTMLRANANDQENERCIEFLKTNCVDRGSISLDNPRNSEETFYNISEKVQQCIMEANSKYIRTYESWAVLPFKYNAGAVGLTGHLDGELQTYKYTLNTTKIGVTNYFINPDPADDNVYVGLKDNHVKSRSAFFFADYICTLTSATDPNNGQLSYFIFNRFAIEKNPLHTDDAPMMFKFKILE